MAQYIHYSVRRFFQTSAIRQAAKAAGEDHEGENFQLIDVQKSSIVFPYYP